MAAAEGRRGVQDEVQGDLVEREVEAAPDLIAGEGEKVRAPDLHGTLTVEKGTVVVDHCEYLDIYSRSSVIFDLGARLPSQVFKGDLGDSLFCEFEAVFFPELWPAFCEMARWHGDGHVELLVLEPDCDDFYIPERLGYPAVSLSVEASVDDYWAAVGFEAEGDSLGSIVISANVVAVTGPSGRWGCWGERCPEVGVFRGFPNLAARDKWQEQFGPFLEVSDALDSYLQLSLSDRAVPAEYAAALTANYGPSGR
ncbi:hypothetical protein PJ985_11430 [Streptomyces sp. ACA25]|uniref:hypothetical protein n=1 Tax=Streptomyces sp. ACA25 TaxID=3022596 RepID=UPI002307EB7C|nr:hypothetical protein [Streptomyces sp. ACA25]MDB1088176.1 hypothetical protein [Streptomyces sp. ACA25]